MKDNSLQSILQEIRKEIKTVPAKKPVKKIYNNGYEVKFIQIGDSKVPAIQTKEVFIQYPSKTEDIRLPKDCVRATYNKELKQVEYYASGNKLIKVVKDSFHDPLPIPQSFSELENVEEILDLDLETGEVICEVRYDILDEKTHWILRLIELQNKLTSRGVSEKVVNSRVEWYAKMLKELRGVDVRDPNFKIAQNVKDAMNFIDNKRFFRG